MSAIVSGIVAAVVLAIIGAFVLSSIQEPAYRAYSTSSTRVDDPGYNLVGEQWTGNPPVPAKGEISSKEDTNKEGS